ncbi:CHAP domain-containing protein [Actinomadura luteofluorescens]|uniref:CHAP domain-containing protein n=1 Tax=Actinomadura luteofluorescens TaxID=46163 RepID=UPI003D8CCF64
MGTAAAMLTEARKSLGLGEPNHIQSWYRSRHGAAYGGNFAWCDAAVTYWAHQSGNAAAVLPGGDRAYTVSHAEDFRKAGRWHAGTTANVNAAKPGDVVFFDWGATNSIGAIDHVGIVEKVLGGGRVQTIEGNTADVCARRIRSSSVIAGLGRPAYSGSSSAPSKPSAANWQEAMVKKLPELSKGDSGEHVQSAQGLLQARSHPEVKIDGEFGPKMEAAVRAVQRWGGVDNDGVIGAQTWPVLLRVH